MIKTNIKLEKGSSNLKIKCPKCGKEFIINPNKHRNRKERYCPRCRMAFQFNVGFSPNLNWLRNKLRWNNLKKGIKPKIHSYKYAEPDHIDLVRWLENMERRKQRAI